MEFKIGDRVIAKVNMGVCKRVKKGMTGTVIYDGGDLIGVEFDKYINGHSCCGKGKYGYCYNCKPNEIEKILKETELIKMTIDEFKKDSRHIAIHCKTKEEIDKVVESMPKLDIQISKNWAGYDKKECILIYNNWGRFGYTEWDLPSKHSAQQIYEFEEIEDFKDKTKMEEIEDITLQKGDRVIFSDGEIYYEKEGNGYFAENHKRVTKIERPIKYETIYEAPDILDKEEKEYLSAVIKPFRNRVIYIKKAYLSDVNEEYISVRIVTGKNCDSIVFPNFKKGTMYKGMKPEKGYTLKELGL